MQSPDPAGTKEAPRLARRLGARPGTALLKGVVKRRLPRRPLRVDTMPAVETQRPRPRLVERGAQESLIRVGLRKYWYEDLYHRALTVSWRGFMLLAAAVYLGANTLFALVYLLQPGAIANARPGSFLDAFFFSVETFGTIGYGVMAPTTVYANIVMTVETLVGIMLVALTAGIMFARVSRPTARVLFSQVAVVTPYNGVPTLMVRMGNQRRNRILQAEVGLTLVRNERTAEGVFMRRFYDLDLARSRTPIFAMSFQVMHALDERSPLHGATAESLEADEVEILVTVTGLDETMSQTVHARASYLPHEVRFGHRYADIFGQTEDGRRAIDYGRFHLTEAV
jgi:inward rectifier potassium channel